MTDEDHEFERYLQRIVEGAVASVLEASDREIEEDIRAEGRDPDAYAEQLRATMLEITDDARKSHYARKERLRRARAAREEATQADSDPQD